MNGLLDQRDEERSNMTKTISPKTRNRGKDGEDRVRKTKRVSKKGHEGKAMETRSRSVTNVMESPSEKP